jgi:ferric-dicitrate binding protein FerR (iron transport regulator)
MSEETDRETEDVVARLLRLAGPRALVPQPTTARVKAAVKSRWLANHRSRRRARLVSFGLAAAALLVLGLVVLLRRDAPEPSLVARTESGRALFTDAEIATGNERSALQLESGASVRVDVDTRVRLLSHHEILLESGAIYVDTGVRSSGALTVITGLGRVTDVGTRFETRATGSSLLVRVREGAVAFEGRAGISHHAVAGTEIEASSSGRVSSRPFPAFGPSWAWVVAAGPGFEIEGRRLEEFLSWVAGETGWSVRYADASLEETASDTVLHGSIEGLTIEEALLAVLPTCGLDHRLEEGTLEIFESR